MPGATAGALALGGGGAKDEDGVGVLDAMSCVPSLRLEESDGSSEGAATRERRQGFVTHT